MLRIQLGSAVGYDVTTHVYYRRILRELINLITSTLFHKKYFGTISTMHIVDIAPEYFLWNKVEAMLKLYIILYILMQAV